MEALRKSWVINFSNATAQLSPTPLANTEANRAKAIADINHLEADGGTELLNGIRFSYRTAYQQRHCVNHVSQMMSQEVSQRMNCKLSH